MGMKKLSLLLVPLAMAACSDRSGAEDAVRASLKDPESARFGEFYYNDKTKKACLTTNAKNSMGGYTGDQQVSLTRENGEWVYISSSETDQATCREIHADAVN